LIHSRHQMEIQKEKLVVIIAMPGTMSLDIAGPSDVFHNANRVILQRMGFSPYKIILASPDDTTSVKIGSGITIKCDENVFNIKNKIDTLIIAGFPAADSIESRRDLIQWLKESANNTRRIASICRGAFLMAEAGFLNNKRATTHWNFCDDLQKNYPQVQVDPDPIFIGDGKFYTSAGVSSGIDLTLALLEEDFGREIALNVARNLVLYLRRPGNQSQFSIVLAQQETSKEPLRHLQKWLLDHLDKNLTVETLAEQCSMSPRNFARVFQKEMKMTPGKYLEKLRVETARRRLEETNLGLDQIARECGLGSADTLRRIFLRQLKITPNQYRRSFKTALEQELTEML
jgi:transcriptional regulator GlxA family with amidase domain